MSYCPHHVFILFLPPKASHNWVGCGECGSSKWCKQSQLSYFRRIGKSEYDDVHSSTCCWISRKWCFENIELAHCVRLHQISKVRRTTGQLAGFPFQLKCPRQPIPNANISIPSNAKPTLYAAKSKFLPNGRTEQHSRLKPKLLSYGNCLSFTRPKLIPYGWKQNWSR